jgi:hypothetical protein
MALTMDETQRGSDPHSGGRSYDLFRRGNNSRAFPRSIA